MPRDPVVVSYTVDPGDMALRGKIGAYRLHATHDARETTAKARLTFAASFERQVDPDLKLAPAERARRAEYARKAHYAKLALASARARSARARSKSRKIGSATADEAMAAAGTGGGRRGTNVEYAPS